MTEYYHAAVWIDHQQARICQFDAEDAKFTIVLSDRPHLHLHHKANSSDSGHAGIEKHFLERVAEAVSGCGTMLITGPANAKKELVAYLEQERPLLAGKIAAVESADHPTNRQLLAHARKFFKAEDRLREQLRH